MCGPHRRFAPLLSRTLRRIPQAVGVVATQERQVNGYCWARKVSIPQAVSAVASSPLFYLLFVQVLEMCGPHRRFAPLLSRTLRRIPQEVGIVTTWHMIHTCFLQRQSFNTVNGKYYCNATKLGAKSIQQNLRFNTVNGRYYCNVNNSTEICSVL